jgi:hypothetical protein
MQTKSLFAQTLLTLGYAETAPLCESGSTVSLNMARDERLRSLLKWLWTEPWTDANFCNFRIRRKWSMAR